ncbi:TIGR03668 family PPOX class F420-dependent oxidoreductase [Streptomyces lanatus]|uniref:TIGR03668 family PPOX class F420-dependent oxidoreductase n=1 Tax=Streptomyces lanatus TaxID=66900 RepID=A0ABV1XX29_9ACTN|nr:TIGR03668 family PPOX class F420-dependent oxidoreductase [Streptomyces lanatus]GHH17071.1 PPOX class F420-dependent oxidoreductase [Streptomyces lanatus]
MPDMEQDEARERFAAASVARLATVDPEGRPHLVPVVFASSGDEIVTAVDGKPKRTRRLKRLHNIAVRPAVCLLADEYDEDWGRLWWVRADGGARILAPDGTEYDDAVALLCRKYPQYRQEPPNGPVVVISVVHWSGWRAVAGDD